ncbi:SigE family RNA polymerase sigma factor [Yinghuangia soli]|uniref:SigE family RNA polymerase sigma factor n=1 Tax=Yinghuangia soli TaxID=2908204 RepID=A0AA41PYU0_9ACTN|nr:SigE family RNA polymerase sigma factor [Yinghuangia soli]MCF2528176.1 SigE family RNA polymerase sigma factor [Yinghuangia soli]
MKREQDFTEYVHARQDRLFRTAYLLCGDRERAKDLAQSTLARLFRHWKNAQRADNIDAYARSVMVRIYMHEQRRARHERELHERLDPPAAPEHTDVRLTLLEALDLLPPKARAVVVLRYWEDMSVETTAKLLGCSEGNVKSQSSRALARLRDMLPAHLLAGTEPSAADI